MSMDDGIGAGIGMGSIGSVGGGGCHFGVASSAEQTLLVIGEEANPVANMIVFLCHKG